MTWELALQSVTASVAVIGGWFIFDVIKEFKDFKKDTRTDVSTLKLQRSQFEITIRNAELSIGLRVNEMQKMHNDFSAAMREAILKLGNDTQSFNTFMKKSLELTALLNDRMKMQEKDLKTLKLQLGEVMIFKSHKNGK